MGSCLRLLRLLGLQFIKFKILGDWLSKIEKNYIIHEIILSDIFGHNCHISLLFKTHSQPHSPIGFEIRRTLIAQKFRHIQDCH